MTCLAAWGCGGRLEADGTHAATGGAATGGAATGGAATGGAATGGAATGGAATGGAATGGAATGGAATGGAATGGAATGGAATGGAATGGAATGGAAGGPSNVDEVCTWPKVQFEFTVDEPSLYCVTSDYASSWQVFGGIRIRAADGQAITYLGAPNMRYLWTCSSPRCATCRTSCPTTVEELYQFQVTSAPRTGQWDGGYDVAGTCGSSSQTCYATRCVQPGRYIAKYCLVPKYDLPSCTPEWFPIAGKDTACIDVPFDFPTAELVRGKITKAMIPPNTAGAAGMSGTAGTSAGG